MLQALEEIYEKLKELESCSKDLSKLSKGEIDKIEELLKSIKKCDVAISNNVINEKTIRKLHLRNIMEEHSNK